MQRMIPARVGPQLARCRAPLPARQIHSSAVRLAEDKSDPAFSPQQTRPEEQDQRASEATKQDSGINATPKVNPANPEPSKPLDPQEGGREGSSAEDGQGRYHRDGPSGGGSPSKSGGGKSG